MGDRFSKSGQICCGFFSTYPAFDQQGVKEKGVSFINHRKCSLSLGTIRQRGYQRKRTPTYRNVSTTLGIFSRPMRSSNCLSSNYSLCLARPPSFLRTDQQSASFGEQCRQESIHNRAKRIPFPSRYQAQPICYLLSVHCPLISVH